MLTVPGYPKPRDYGQALERLRPDARGIAKAFRRMRGWLSGEQAATYGVLQQLLPGEEQVGPMKGIGMPQGQCWLGDGSDLRAVRQEGMGTQVADRKAKEEGRLGPRGAERVPSFET